MDELLRYSANSANDSSNKYLWLKGASLFIPQLNMLLEHTNYNPQIINIEDFQSNYESLGEIFTKYGSDKKGHNYHILYSFILDKLGKNSNLRILEIGLGTNNTNIVSNMGKDGSPGASLYAFREYLPNANIYGADIDTNILFEEERIKTFFVDQLELNTFDKILRKTNNIKFDLIIDDGLHSIGANFNTLIFALNNINQNGWIVIEDIHIIDNWKSIDYILTSTNKFKTYIIKSKHAFMYVCQKL